MNLIFMRHGEATDNVAELISDKEIYWSVLTNNGIKTVKESVDMLPDNIDIMYVSPFPRTIQTAHYVYEKYPTIKVNIDSRLSEIFYGKYSHQKNNSELDEIRKKQICGDYFIRFGKYGENKYDIEKRLIDFLLDIYNKCDNSATILIVSHGSITSYMKRILDIKAEHLDTGEIAIFKNVDFSNVLKHERLLNEILIK